ncbi:hypothetical protein BJ165DRAFT_1516527 [Panaeolus papilionaceus]|nr:hypothetical protein BJ165DRAFT_1516527 [Panaeolus papilionaceus]
MSAVRVPSWANLDIIAQGAFDPNRARDSVNPPPSPTRRPPPPPDPTTTPISDPTRTPRPDPTPDPTSADADPATSNSTPTRTSNSRTTTASDDTSRTPPGQSTSTHTITDSSNPPPPDSTSQTSLGDDAVADTQVEKKKPPIGAIVGGVGGGILFIAILCSIYVFFCMRRRRRSQQSATDTIPPTAVSPFFDNALYRDCRSMSPPMSNPLTGNAMSIKSTSQSNVFNPFIDGSERMTERTTSPSRLSVQYTNSISDPPNHAPSDRSMAKGHQPSPSFATTLSNSNSNWNSTSSPSYNNQPEHQPQHTSHVDTSSSMPFRPVRRPPDDDLESVRTSTRLSRAGYLPPPYDPSTAPPMPMATQKG